jgi:mono/diheme cytochrome c family protein
MRLALPLLLVTATIGSADDRWKPDAAGHAATVAPFFRAHCESCHAGDKPKGGLDLTAKGLANDFTDPATAAKWKEIVEALNGHTMPPKKEKQPDAKAVAAVVDWIVEQSTRAELAKRERGSILRRLNREEYRNTIRDLVGIDFDVSGFPQDPPAGGFDNNGGALTMSPLHLETYLNAARQIVDRAIVPGAPPEKVRWRFQPKVGDIDRTRVRVGKNNAIVNGGRNRQDGDWVVVHHDSWDKHVGARDFAVPVAGDYVIRIKAAGKTPSREEVVKSAEAILRKRRDDQNAKNPKGEKFAQQQYERDLEHFKTDRMYGYGPPRAKLILQLGPQPRTVAEFDADGTPEKPTIHEFPVRFTTERAGIGLEYAYAIPRVLENFWMQSADSFARPELMIEWIEIEGPIHDAWPPSSHTGLVVPMADRPADDREYAARLLAAFMRKAFRRPVTAEEVEVKMKHFDAARKDGESFTLAMKRPLVAVLASPNFLYLVEPARAAADRALNDHELAARLSYLAWSSQPDAELRRAADAGELRHKAKRLEQLDRMLADPKADAFVRNFAGQWLGLREVGNNPPAADLYPQYDRHLETSIVRESEAFFREVLQHDLDARTLVKSDFVVVNERLARYYGVDGVKGDHFRRVPVPASVHRGGIPTQASILTITSNGTRTSPVKRGTWILKTLLGIDPGLPVANAGEIAPKVPGIDKATVRKRLEIHRTLDQCARCHNKIDPLGFALENYNAAGEWREREGFGYKGRVQANDPLIDASSEMIDGTKIAGVAGLQDAILKQEDRFLECLAGKVMTYALGRETGLADRPTVLAAVAHMKANGRTLKSLLRFVAASEPFGTK